MEKMVHVETLPGMGEGTFVNVTMHPHSSQQLNKKTYSNNTHTHTHTHTHKRCLISSPELLFFFDSTGI
jgi:hypothetical protein